MSSWIGIIQWKKIEKDSDDFWHRKLTLKVKFWLFLTPPHYTNSHNSIIFFGYVDSYAKKILLLYPSLENSITCITIVVTEHYIDIFFSLVLIFNNNTGHKEWIK